SSLAEASCFPSGLKASADTGPVCPLYVTTGCLLATSQTVTVPSSLAEASDFPSGLNASPKTRGVVTGSVKDLPSHFPSGPKASPEAAVAAKVKSSSPVLTSQTAITRDCRVAASRLPSGVNATAQIASSSPLRVQTSSPAPTSHTFTASPSPVTSRWPSGL